MSYLNGVQYKNTSETEDSQGSECKLSETEAEETGKFVMTLIL